VHVVLVGFAAVYLTLALVDSLQQPAKSRAAAYDMAKRIIHLVVKVGDLINKDPDTRDLLRLYFLPDYNVSLAEVIIPGESR
jgi:glucan phosphorylase